MIRADLLIVGISELATPQGTTPRAGADLGRLSVVEDAAVACCDDKIVWVGARRDVDQAVRTDDAQTLDAGGGTVLPGFVDAHTHLPFAGWREQEFDERLRGATYSEIAARGGGILSTVERTREASREELTRSVRERLARLARLGTTTVEAKSGYGLEPEAELKQLQALRDAAADGPLDLVPTFLGAHTVPREYRQDRTAYVRLLIDTMLPQVAEAGLAEYADAFVDAHAFSLDEARQVLEAARSHGLGVRLHADQLDDDGAAALAAELGAASADHLEFSSDEGIEALARAGTCGVLLPAATFFLMSDTPPPGRRLIDAGVPVVVATDFNPGSCPCDSMTAALWFACLTARLTVDEAITAATLNAACALGRGKVTGTIEPGKRADLVVHDVPNRYHLVYRFGTPAIKHVIAAGKLID
ncbi:MAG: imidazolonepropionase [Acidobacteria bacterium]|nr:imidazolonepropionase [Acidobacteriota bacterium]NIM63993.1 imidazolonepropionase [Acidobacteriota bacterium]NIO60199.1 imidazolonepropionase [Acidobacteriota bacterium]NIQ31261.1 imidazolonepropionase [Acidobacteriota bacterium]NIQ86409.1 imidazolonepropionase [Acidobacteriota bacterium]